MKILKLSLIILLIFPLFAFIATSITLNEKCGAIIPSLPHIFQGYAKYGSSVLVNKTVTATFDGVDFSTTTNSDGFYMLGPARCSNSTATAITFKVCTIDATQTATFSEGAISPNFNLTIPSSCPNESGGGGGGGAGAIYFVEIGDSPIKGDINAPITLIEFIDYQCPFCGRYYRDTYPLILDNYVKTGKVKIVVKDFPLDFHLNAEKAAEAAHCFREQRGDIDFFNYHDRLFENQNNLSNANFKKWAQELGANSSRFNDCLDTGKYFPRVQADISYGNSLSVVGVPPFFINGIRLDGAYPYANFSLRIEQAFESSYDGFVFIQLSILQQLMDEIETQLETVKQWLFFWNWQEEGENLCDAIRNECAPEPQIECYNDSQCEGSIRIYCMNNDVYEDFCQGICINPGFGNSHCDTQCSTFIVSDCDDETEICSEEGIPSIARCVPKPRTVIFRTSADSGSYILGTWIALDTNNDDVLEGYDYSGSSGLLSNCKGTHLVTSPTQNKVYLYDSKVYVCMQSREKFIWKKYYKISTTAETSLLPTEPYASNNQEVYANSDSSSAGNEGGSGGSGGESITPVNVSIDVRDGTGS